MRPPRPSRGLPTSRAYWELKAEQMMNRVFSPEAAIDLESRPAEGEASQAIAPHRPSPPLPVLAARPPHHATGAQSGGQRAKTASPPMVWLFAAIGGVGLVGALSAVLLVQQWAGLQRALSQERNLLLVERLRVLGPATSPPTSPPVATTTPPAPVLDPIQPTAQQPLAETEALPPPPPEEPWMEQLAQLPPTPGGAPLLRVPVSARLTAAAPPISPRRAAPSQGSTIVRRTAQEPRAIGAIPQLVGLVGAPGRAGTAIFQVGDTSTNVNVGEQIGSSGWSLRAADAESALIERAGEVRRIAIVSGG